MTSSGKDSYNSLLSSGSIFLGDVMKTAFHGDSWHRMIAATVVPLVASALWYSSRTVIEVTDSEQAMWIRMWLCAQQKALQRVRKLRLLSPTDKLGRRGNMDPYDRPNNRNSAEEDDDREEGGRFAPPKLEFLPANNVSAWSWFGWWPVSVVSSTSGHQDPYRGPYQGSNPGYTLTVWFAPWGTSVARAMLFQGRQLWLAKRARKTEIWMVERHRSPVHFKILSRPSRPLSTVIVENGIKEALVEDTKQFLNSQKWYYNKGIPYRRGVLLYGPPGCGKTSLITAVAGELRLPIIFVQLEGGDMSDQLLMDVLSDAPRDSIVLIEDIDCALRNSSTASSRQMRRMGVAGVTLSGLLNALDGVAAQEGRLLFMTTNHLDRLDDALTRPGRVDIKFYLGKASKEAAGELFDQFFASSLSDGTFTSDEVADAYSMFLANVEDGKHSFAALQGALMMARDDPRLVQQSMKNLSEAQEPVSLHCSHCKGATGQCGCMQGCEAPAEAQCENIHIGVECDNCHVNDFSGARYHCAICHNYDLCDKCYDGGAHDLTHEFWKIARFGAKPQKIEPRKKDISKDNDNQSKPSLNAADTEESKEATCGNPAKSSSVDDEDEKKENTKGKESTKVKL